MSETDRFQTLLGGGESVAASAEFERQRHILERRHGRNQVKGLKDDADPSTPEPGDRVLVKKPEIVAVEPHASGARPLEATDYHHQGGFARARRTDQADGLAGGDLERDAAQDVDGPRGTPQSQMNIFQRHKRAAGMKRCGHVPSELRAYGQKLPVFNEMRLIGCLLAASLSLAAAIPAWAHPPVILDFGDSLTAGYGLPPEQAFPARLEAWLRSKRIEARVVNAGVSGDTTAGGLARIDWALADKPDLVILALGANDALRGIDPKTVHTNLDRMIQKVEAVGAKVLLLGMVAPPNWGEEYKHDFDRVFPELARAHHVPLYSFFLEGVAMKPELNQADGIHPNAAGVAVLVDSIGPIVAQLVGGIS
jgi:acyl-CoA thioesterase I